MKQTDCYVYLLSESALSVKPEVPHVYSYLSKNINCISTHVCQGMQQNSLDFILY